jgi:3-oxoacyl-[acyl-carrier protein] reductase
MSINLDDKVAIVTGSIQGIGAETARIFAENGADVVINHHLEEERLKELAESISKETGAKIKPVLADVTRREEGQKLVDAAKDLGGVDILVNNAGGLIERVPVSEFDEEHFQKVMDVNTKGAFLMSSLVLRDMKEKGSGKIINLSSQAAHDGGGGGAAAYAASKGAVWTFTKSLCKEVASDGITVNAISPGFILKTDFHDTFTPKEKQKKVVQKIPLGRGGEARDVAKVALFLASSLSDYMTGESIQVNGGLFLH